MHFFITKYHFADYHVSNREQEIHVGTATILNLEFLVKAETQGEAETNDIRFAQQKVQL